MCSAPHRLSLRSPAQFSPLPTRYSASYVATLVHCTLAAESTVRPSAADLLAQFFDEKGAALCQEEADPFRGNRPLPLQPLQGLQIAHSRRIC